MSHWDNFVNHPLQSWAWGEFRQGMGIDVVRMHHWQISFHPIPHTSWTIGYFPKGPLPDKQMVEELTRLGVQKHAVYIQLEPNSTEGHSVPAFPTLVPSHHPLFTKHTFILDLTKSESELLAAMHSKTRYNLRVAQRHGVIIKEDNSEEAFEAYLKLNNETTARQGFFAHNATYHKTMWRTLRHAKLAHLFTATYKEKVLATWIIFTFRNAVYYPYGASSRDHREVMAPTLLLWEIAKWAKVHGYVSFDLWGALGPHETNDTNNPWYGFHRFKQGFNPTVVSYVGSYDLIISPLLYQGYRLADTLRWLFLKHIASKFL